MTAGRSTLPPGWQAAVTGTPFFEGLKSRIDGGGRACLIGLPGSLGPLVLTSLLDQSGTNTLVAVLPDGESAEEAAQDFTALLGTGSVVFIPEWHFEPYEELAPPHEISSARYAGLLRLHTPGPDPTVVVLSAGALSLPVPSGAEQAARTLHLVEGEELSFEETARWLVDSGYERTDLVQGPPEFAIRGGLIDLAPPGRAHGVRVEWWGDRVEAVREFRLRDQKAVGGIASLRLLPHREVPVDGEALLRAAGRAGLLTGGEIHAGTPLGTALQQRSYREGLEWYLPILSREPATVADLVGPHTLLAVWETDRCLARLDHIQKQTRRAYDSLLDPRGWLPPERVVAGPEVLDRMRDMLRGADLEIVAPAGAGALQSGAHPTVGVRGDLDMLRQELGRIHAGGVTTILLVEEEGQRARLRDLLTDEEEAGLVVLGSGSLSSGFVWAEAGLAVWPDHEIFRRPRRRIVRTGDGPSIRSWRSLDKGDLVVHVDHGIGRYEGLRTLELDGVPAELLELVYAGGDKLLVLIDQMDRVQRYVGGNEEHPPKLATLGSQAWERTKERARRDLLEMAEDLAQLHAKRREHQGVPHPPDDLLMEELEASFPYAETPDQARAMEEVKRDLESPRPMDRLICGDVGYGKTEVAIRAALKVVEGGYQVAVLVPTTLLAQQHLETFRERLRKFPVRVEMLSRFRTRSQQQRVVAALTAGDVDVVIGTHRLLGRDIQFAALGLVVIDEEHRFGVKAKESLKRIRTQVDVLSLTATPIPRTLHMSLSGLRDMSTITTPPSDRLPVHTEVVRFDESLIGEAITRELDRGGQVFFVHNRVRSIEAVRKLVERLVPSSRIQVAHGRMGERQLEQAMIRFASGEVDVLVASMIVESGLDIPNANTLIVNRADQLGMAQLYQLKGRVGRSSQKAFAYFMVPHGRHITLDARRRLQALQEHTDLGAGMHLALRDLEIRGAGNLLGAQQHGHVSAVGMDLFRQMLEEAVAGIQGSPERAWMPPRLELPAEARLPSDYLPIAGLRVDFYRRVVEARSYPELGALAGELRDRFGPPPGPVGALLDAAAMRIVGAELGLHSLVVKEGFLEGRFREERGPDRGSWEDLMDRLGSEVRFSGGAPLSFRLPLASEEPFGQVQEARNRLLTEEEAGYLGSLTGERHDA